MLFRLSNNEKDFSTSKLYQTLFVLLLFCAISNAKAESVNSSEVTQNNTSFKSGKAYKKYNSIGNVYGTISGGVANSLLLSGGQNISNTGGLFSGSVGGTIGLSVGYNFNVAKNFQFGVEAAGRWFFQEIQAQSLNGVPTTGAGYDSNGQQFIGLQVVPALTFHDQKVGMFLIVGLGYSFMSITGSISSNIEPTNYNLGGVGVIYGLGAFVRVQEIASFFIRGISMAPIPRTIDMARPDRLTVSLTAPAYAIEVGINFFII